jgi:hypothetical protein
MIVRPYQRTSDGSPKRRCLRRSHLIGFSMRKVGRTLQIILGVALYGAVLPIASAHHSYAMFDKSKKIEVNGTVRAWQLVEPHSWLDIASIGEDGTVQDWAFECSGSSALVRAKLFGDRVSASTFKPGDKVTVVAWRLRDGRMGGYALSVKLEDGRVLELFPAGPPTSTPSQGDATGK